MDRYWIAIGKLATGIAAFGLLFGGALMVNWHVSDSMVPLAFAATAGTLVGIQIYRH